MRFGLKVNAGTWPEATQWAQAAQDLGFDGLWTGDNMRNPRDPAIPVLDGPTLIGAWAATTTRIRVGLLIANIIFRQPAVLAKQAVTLDHVSGGRFDLGIGSGLWPTDHAMSGVAEWSRAERAERLTEFVEVIARLLAGDVSEHSGKYYNHSQAAMSPAPIQSPVPLIIAANGAQALSVAASHAWVTFPGAATEEDFYQATSRRIRALPADGRKILLAYGAITPWSSPDAFARMVERYQGIGITEIVCYAPKPAEAAVFEKVTARLADFR